jgi:hypothetical protein
MFILAEVTSWQDKRDSSYRVAPADGGSRFFLLNPNRFFNIKADPSNAAHSQFEFYDNHLDRRESYGYVKANVSVAEIIAADDTAFHSNMMTFDIHRNNNPNKATVATTLPVSCIAYFDDYNQDNEHVWMVYYCAAWRRHEVLVHGTLEGIEDKLRTGTSTSTSTTTTESR